MIGYQLINFILDNNSDFDSYLEIGVRTGFTIKKVNASVKDGVDIVHKCRQVNFVMSSDRFFRVINDNVKYHVIFIDGFHVYEQAMRDIDNSLRHLHPDGYVVIHDCNPPNRWYQRPYKPPMKKGWNGTVWKAIANLRCTRPDLSVCVVDTDWGFGIVRKGHQELFTKKSLQECMDYQTLSDYRIELLNLITVEEFKKRTVTNQ